MGGFWDDLDGISDGRGAPALIDLEVPAENSSDKPEE
jgi:hypothetical protein